MQVESDYYDEDYGELFATYILNMRREDLANMTSLVPVNETFNGNDVRETGNPSSLKSWMLALNILAGFGILTNSILAFMIIVDFIIDVNRRHFTRHWLLLHAAMLHISFLSVSVYFKEFGLQLSQHDRKCVVLQHMDKALEFVAILHLSVIAVNILGNVLQPTMKCGVRQIAFWILFILFIMVCANLAVLALFTMKIEGILGQSALCQPEVVVALALTRSDANILAIVTFFLPYGILISLAFSTLLCYCRQRRKLTLESSNVNDYYTSRKHSAIFIFIISTAGFLLMLPYYMFQVPAIAHVVLTWFKDYYLSAVYCVIILIKLIFYITCPLFCLCLKEVKQIYRKATSI